ncbi:MAG: L-erythro-3,5-diaminohexanoate dehydrogenase [Syntrophales bacterium]|nr:L-erythro-3,5-diaminohexanoate dehydrogenase [Syntrophales bacterium]MCK9528687.1 L-erythro-3,5-diaminohexanoate dehydrogenase [Syntrophales bacterium]MDX9922640.1 L-erythro-3,5-diaminohexanoate dehydrogenase [Syntrophales bacterium]
MNGCEYGTHRVISPKGLLPQAADKLNNNMEEFWDNEIMIDVAALNVDSASFTQIREEADGDENEIAKIIMRTVAERGKQHNPVTGSGGMLIGKVERIGESLKEKVDIVEGDKIATLVSLTLTPLYINKIKKVYIDKDRVEIDGKAIIFEKSIFAKLPDDMSESLALAVFDVAGAPAQVAKMVTAGMNVVIMGAGGKSGMLCCYEAKKRAGITGKVIGVEVNPNNADRLERLNLCDHVIRSAESPIQLKNTISEITLGEMADITYNLVNVPNTEMASIMATKDDGIAYFFSMATSFTKATLGAEGIKSDAKLVMGNGYTAGHDEISLQILRENNDLRKLYEEIYA